MPASPVSTFLEQLRDSRLLEQTQVEELSRTWQSRTDDPRVLAKELLQRNWLTPFQVNQLLQGNGKELVLGQYRLLERLGEGGMGQVYKALHIPMERIVALKVMRPERLENEEAVRRFQKEIRAASQLVHPNIVMAYDAGQVGETHFFAMEYIDGIDLAKMVKQQGPLPYLQACDYIRQAAQGLQHAHEQGLVHRDIKPANLLVSRPQADRPGMVPRAVVKILDMGLARLQEPDSEGKTVLTRLGTVVGTPQYMAPEQALNSSKVDIRADLYSLGCTFYFLLAGHPPFIGESAMDVMIRHRTEEAPDVSRFRPDVPAEVWAVVRKLMAKKADQRYQTPNELIEALKPFCRRGSGAASLPTPTPITARAPAALSPAAPKAPVPATKAPAASAPAVSRPRRGPEAEREQRRKVLMGTLSLLGVAAAVVVAMPLLFPQIRNRFGDTSTPEPDEQLAVNDKGTPPTPEPKVDPKPEPKTDPTPEPKTDPRPGPKTDPTPEPKTDPTPEPKTDPKPEPKVDPKPEPKIDLPEPKPEPKKVPVPADAARDAAVAEIKQEFEEDYARKEPKDLIALADKLLKAKEELKDTPVRQFVLLSEARDLAARGGDLETAFRAIDELDRNFTVDPMALKVATLEQASRSITDGDKRKALVEMTLTLAEENVARDNYPTAANLFKLAEGTAKAAELPKVQARAESRLKEVAELQKEYERVRPAREQLLKGASDPKASLEWGRFLCFAKGNWDEGLPLLAEGSDPQLKTLAQKEIAEPTGAKEQKELGDEYYRRVAQASGLAQTRLQQRARHWYQQALAKLSGRDKEAVEARLQLLDKLSSTDEPVVGKPPPATTPTPSKQAEFNKAMYAGNSAMAKKKWGEAIQHFTEATNLFPKNAIAQAKLKEANFQWHMSEGERYFHAKKFQEAKHEFRKAQELMPDNPLAGLALDRVKQVLRR